MKVSLFRRAAAFRCMGKWGSILILIAWGPLTGACVAGEQLPSDDAFEPLEIRSVTVNNKSKPLGRNGEVSLGSRPENISLGFGIRTNARQAPIRIRYKLDGYDTHWRDGD